MSLCERKRKREEEEEEEEEEKEEEEEEEKERGEKGGIEKKEEEGRGKGFCCGVCGELMCWEREPRVLPCGHSFCLDCIKKLSSSSSSSSSSSDSKRDDGLICEIQEEEKEEKEKEKEKEKEEEKERSFYCPECKTKYNDQFNVDSFRVNGLIPKIVDILISSSSKENEEPNCINFEECGQKTSMYCPNCQMFVCDICHSLSHSTNIFTQHHIREKREREREKRNCLKHSSEVVDGYCLDCRGFVCCLCCNFEEEEEEKEEKEEKEKEGEGEGEKKREEEKKEEKEKEEKKEEERKHEKHHRVIPLHQESPQKRKEEVLKLGIGLEKKIVKNDEKQKETDEEVRRLEEMLRRKEEERNELGLKMDDLRNRM